jgi:hypothetical protein
LTAIASGISNLVTEVATLTSELASGSITPAQQDALDTVTASLASLGVTADAAVASLPASSAPPVPAPPAPPA